MTSSSTSRVSIHCCFPSSLGSLSLIFFFQSKNKVRNSSCFFFVLSCSVSLTHGKILNTWHSGFHTHSLTHSLIPLFLLLLTSSINSSNYFLPFFRSHLHQAPCIQTVTPHSHAPPTPSAISRRPRMHRRRRQCTTPPPPHLISTTPNSPSASTTLSRDSTRR